MPATPEVNFVVEVMMYLVYSNDYSKLLGFRNSMNWKPLSKKTVHLNLIFCLDKGGERGVCCALA